MLSVRRRYPPYHYCTSSSLKHWQDAGAFILFIPNCDTTDWMRLRLFFQFCAGQSAGAHLLQCVGHLETLFCIPWLLWVVILVTVACPSAWICPISSDIKQGIFAQKAAAYWIFSFFMDHPLQRCLCWKILADLQFLKSSNQPIWLTALPHLK